MNVKAAAAQFHLYERDVEHLIPKVKFDIVIYPHVYRIVSLCDFVFGDFKLVVCFLVSCTLHGSCHFLL